MWVESTLRLLCGKQGNEDVSINGLSQSVSGCVDECLTVFLTGRESGVVLKQGLDQCD